MNTTRLCSFGYFDRIIIDGYTIPVYNAKGITIKGNESLTEAIKSNANSYEKGIGKLRITIYGEADFNMADENLLNMRFHREQKLRLQRVKVGNKDRYAIAYADILILKSEFAEIHNKSKKQILNEILVQTKSEDEYLLVSKAIEIQTSDVKKINIDDCNIAIIDRVYTNISFRGCGISGWIHDNIKEIVHTFSMINVSAALLIPGDFSSEASLFEMSDKEYKNYLTQHYKKHGYSFIDRTVMYKNLKDDSDKFLIAAKNKTKM